MLDIEEKSSQFQRKIYLDQKDYSRIAKGLLGDSHFREDFEAYHFLISLLDSHKVLIYSSWCHLFEALKYDEDKVDLLTPYCEAVDALTNGNCIVWPETIEKRELELFFSKHFGFTSQISQNEYPYGKPKDLICIGDISEPIFEPDTTFRDKLRKELDSLPLSGKEKKYISRRLNKPKILRALLGKFPEENLSILYKQFPGTEKKFGKDKMIDFLLSSPREKAIIFEDVLGGAFTYKNLVTHYSRIFPQLKMATHCFDDSPSKIRSFMRMNQFLYDIFGKQVNEAKLSHSLVNSYTNYLAKDIAELANRYHFPIDEAKRLLAKDKFENITSVKVVIFFLTEYYKRHKGSYEKGRRPLESDIMDLHHLRCFPYVNFYITDRFFADIAKKGEDLFETKVFLNLSGLQKYLKASEAAGEQGCCNP